MAELLSKTAGRWLWALVTAVGVLVIALVLALQLIPRLHSGQRVLDDAKPAFTDQRVAAHPAAITIVSQIVDLSDPIATPKGGAAAEVPKLVAFVAAKTGLAPAQVLAALKAKVPHTTEILQAIPLSAVTAELPGVVAFLAKTLKVSPEALLATLRSQTPRLAQSIAALPTVTRGWNDVPGTQDLKRFSGAPVKSVPDVRDYYAKDVLPVLERQRANFQNLGSKGGVGFVPYLLLTLGGLVTFFGAMMLWSNRTGAMSGAEGMAMWGVVLGGGLTVLALVLGLSLFGRLDGGQKLLDDAKPAFTDERVAGDRAAINMVSSIVDLADPIATDSGGAAAEVPKLVGLVSQKTGLPQAKVLAALQKAAPHTTALLQAIPLSAVTAEIPTLAAFLSKTLNVSGDQLIATLQKSFPGLAQVISNIGPVTSGWNDVPGVSQLTRFSGAPVKTVPDVRDYFSKDVVPVLERRRGDFQKLESTWPPVNWFPPLLAIIGAVVALLGLLMVLASRRGFRAGPASAPPTATPAPAAAAPS